MFKRRRCGDCEAKGPQSTGDDSAQQMVTAKRGQSALWVG